jgi:pimeloyl-ACP methyl ester carboxylesterase
MSNPMRWIVRVIFLVLVLAALVAGFFLAQFTSWRSEKLAELQGASEVVDTAAGPWEYAAIGDGEPVLVLHGAPGGFDQGLVLGRGLRERGFRVIAPSRPGYLRTPLESGLLPIQQAGGLVALLDELGLARVAVVAFSDGGPVALELALRHPERVSALALVSARTKRFDPHARTNAGTEFGREILRGLTGDIGSYVAVEAAKRDPARGIAWMLERSSTASPVEQATLARGLAAQAEAREWFERFQQSFAPLSPRETGTRNDLLQNLALAEFPFPTIQVPVLLVHGEQDSCVLLGEAEAAAAKIPQARLVKVPGAGHVVPLSADGAAVEETLAAFLRNPSAP